MPAFASGIFKGFMGRGRASKAVDTVIGDPPACPAPPTSLAADISKIADLEAQLAVFTKAVAVAEYAPDGSVLRAKRQLPERARVLRSGNQAQIAQRP